MTIFKSSDEIFSSKWQTEKGVTDPPRRYEWLHDRVPTFEDVDYWEELYIQPGNIGVYAAYSPYVEIFIIVHYSIFPAENRLEIFTNPEAENKIIQRLKDFDIKLPTKMIYVY